METWTDILMVCAVTGVIVFWKDIVSIFKKGNGDDVKKG